MLRGSINLGNVKDLEDDAFIFEEDDEEEDCLVEKAEDVSKLHPDLHIVFSLIIGNYFENPKY